MRHIPEDEIHAYLDQALSRSQCVEIERHLARCPRCQMERDSIAALRDRTTALLARIGPPPIIPPAFETLMARAAVREQRRWRWVRAGSWAASIGAVLFLGWWMSGRLFTVEPHQSIATAPPAIPAHDTPKVETVPAPAVTEVKHHQPRTVRPNTPKPSAPLQLVRASRPVGDEAPAVTDFARADETDPPAAYQPAQSEQIALGTMPPLELSDLVAQPVNDDPALNGLWRTVVPDKDYNDHRSEIALVPGLPVIQMRVQPGSGGTDVTAVDQTLESGEMIRTISGPASRVLALVNEEADADSASRSSSSNHMTVTIRQADRMVAVTGPSNALGSLLARVNLKTSKRRY